MMGMKVPKNMECKYCNEIKFDMVNFTEKWVISW